MKHCPNPDCHGMAKFKIVSEFNDTADICSDCQTPLVDGPAPRPDELGGRPKPDPNIELVPILVAGYYLQGLYFVLTKGIIYAKRTGLLPVISVGAAMVNIGLNLWLIPRYGMYAAAWTTVVSFGLMALAARWMSGRLVEGIFQDGALICIVLLFVVAYLSNHVVAGLGWGLPATLGVKVVLLAVLLGGFPVLRVITLAELRGLGDRLRGRKKGPPPTPPTEGANADMDGPPPVQ